MDSLLKELFELQKLLNQKPDDKLKVIEAYNYFVTNRGKDCSYAQKCLKLFEEDMYDSVKERIYTIYRILKEMENV